MTDQLWDWQRLWIPATEQRSLAKARLLPDNIQQMNPRYQALSQLSARRLLLLLGEPGTGKSTELRRLKDEQLTRTASHQVLWLDGRTLGSDYRLDREWFDSARFKSWLAGDHDLWIFFDGYDQSSAQIRGIGSTIESHLTSAPLDRLYLRISSRTGEWNYPLGKKLDSLFNRVNAADPDAFSSFVLAPPRVADIVTALTSEGLDAPKFMEQLDKIQIGPVALRPIGLKWLINIFRTHGRFPESAEELYWHGMKILSQESVEGEKKQNGHGLSAEEVRQVAARIAFVAAFSNRDSVWTGLDLGNIPETSVAVPVMTGGVETQHGISTPVNESVLRQSLKRGIFSELDADNVGWAHQTFREFLAARYCVERNLLTAQILGLLTNPSDH